MGSKEKILKEMEEAMEVKWKELAALTDKLAENTEEFIKLNGRLSEQARKIEQQSISTIQQQEQEKVVDSRLEEAALKAELAAHKMEREELTAAWNAKRQECQEFVEKHCFCGGCSAESRC
jgi:hypothetical protein